MGDESYTDLSRNSRMRPIEQHLLDSVQPGSPARCCPIILDSFLSKHSEQLSEEQSPRAATFSHAPD